MLISVHFEGRVCTIYRVLDRSNKFLVIRIPGPLTCFSLFFFKTKVMLSISSDKVEKIKEL